MVSDSEREWLEKNDKLRRQAARAEIAALHEKDPDDYLSVLDKLPTDHLLSWCERHLGEEDTEKFADYENELRSRGFVPIKSVDKECSVASLPNDIRQVGDYMISRTRTGIQINHEHLVNHIWISDSDIEPILEAAKALKNAR